MVLIIELLSSVIALFVIVDPLGNVPIFLGLTHGTSSEGRKRIFKLALITALVLLVVFAIFGKILLGLLMVNINSFRIAGGTLLLILATKILIYGTWEERSIRSESAGAVPIAFPLLAGPGAITNVIVINQTAGMLVALVSIGVVMGVTGLILHGIKRINEFLGSVGSIVIARIMAVFIAAIAIQYIVEGIRASF
ncbi:MAG: MarC family protein [Nitrososphaerales archaeon]